MTIKEEWKDVKGYERMYRISNLGKLESYSRSGGMYEINPRIGADGYYKINLYRDGYNRTFRLHRLVAQTFIPNPDNLPQVRFFSSDRLDCRVSNLHWAETNQRNQCTVDHVINKGRAISQYDLEGNLIATYKSATEACKAIGKPKAKSALGKSIERNGTSYGYVWKWVE